MNKYAKLNGSIIQLIVLVALFSVSLSSNAHIVGLSWKDIGDNTVRFYGETAHGDIDQVYGGAVQTGPWSIRENFYWTDWTNNTTLAELGVDGMAYWDPDGPESIVAGTDYYEPHVGGADYFGDFFYVDVANFFTGDYLLTLESCCAPVDRRLGNDYLSAYIKVPEPPVFALFGMGLLAMLIRKKAKKI